MFMICRNRDNRKEIIAECDTKEEAMRKGEEAFAKREKGDTFTMIAPCDEEISFSSDGQIMGKYLFYKYWY